MREIQIEDKIITITHSDKVLFPKDNITKWDLVNYYHKIADYILPFIRNRPLTINCFPGGVSKEGFYRQHAPEKLPDWFNTYELKRKMGGSMNHILCQDKASLIYLVNLNMITIHRWLSTTLNPEHPEILVIDIDPPKERFDLACTAAKLLKAQLEFIDYKPYLMATGLRGLHIISKVKGNSSFEQIREILHNITSDIASEHPKEFSVNVRKKDRKDLVYLDITRNAYGQTSVAPFSVRAEDGAPIATPIAWEELKDITLNLNKYTMNNIFDRLTNIKRDPWHDYQA